MFLISGASKEALKSGLSDMDYLRSKVAQTDDTMEESVEKDEEEEEDDDGDEGGDDEEEEPGSVQHADSAYESGERENSSKTKLPASSEDKKQKKVKKTAAQEVSVEKHPLLHTRAQDSTGFAFSLYLLTHSSVCSRWSQRQSSQWSWEELLSTLKRWLNTSFGISEVQWRCSALKHWGYFRD